jgi:putative transposase
VELSFPNQLFQNCARNVDPIVNAWNTRPLSDTRFPFVLVDALYLKIREDGRVRSRGLMIAAGINETGHREILGFMVGDTESEDSWSELFVSLKNRGLRGLDTTGL